MNTVQQVEQKECPFCPEFLPGQPELWDKVEPEKQIDGMAACGGCAMFAGYATTDPEYVGFAVDRLRARGQEAQG